MLFVDLPDEVRVRFRRAVADAGGVVDGYYGEYMQVCCPRPVGPFLTAMREAGLACEEGMSLFPLGSDNPPEHLRHDGSYPGSRGFWLHARLFPVPQLTVLGSPMRDSLDDPEPSDVAGGL